MKVLMPHDDRDKQSRACTQASIQPLPLRTQAALARFDTILPHLFFMRPSALIPPCVFSNLPLMTSTFAKRPRATLETRFAFITTRFDLLFLSEASFAKAMMRKDTRVNDTATRARCLRRSAA